ncbi:hypothetical protein BCR35DRAFT_308787 [Leucosporidium creatinivorum]|uniref:F-box domain-containing protein n=1 Tax=Leucosporidium creatinivorum TaxID=106004 RepID=A0A1Y2DX03_9BASI|nr:hypothetical protein BCR35DRAFT_308787 [Leucosporidium creatinivorum]
MDSNDTKLEQKSSKMVHATPSAVEAFPSSISTLSLNPPKPKTFTDLPDELLDNIALFASPPDLASLALVERRLRKPAQRHAVWRARGFKRLMELAEVLLTRRRLARVIFHVHLHSGDDYESIPHITYQPNSDLAFRAINVIFEELPNLQSLTLGPVILSVSTQKQLMATIGELKRLKSAHIGVRGCYIKTEALALALPAFHSSESLTVAVEVDPTLPLPHLPQCSISTCTLTIFGINGPKLSTLLDSLATGCRSILVGLRDRGEHPLMSTAEVEDVCRPFIVKTRNFYWTHIVRGNAQPHHPNLPSNIAWLLFVFLAGTSPSAGGMRNSSSTHCFTSTGSKAEKFVSQVRDDVMMFARVGFGRCSVKAGRKAIWGEKNVAALNAIAERDGLAIKWC